MNEKQKRYKAKKRAFVDNLKKGPCVDCGIEYPPYVMDFDHLEDKSFNIAWIVSRNLKGMAFLQQEIDKCELVCANCHRERTHKRNMAH